MHNRCTNTATVIKSSENAEGYNVLAYCESCFKDYNDRTKKRRKERTE